MMVVNDVNQLNIDKSKLVLVKIKKEHLSNTLWRNLLVIIKMLGFVLNATKCQ